MCNNGRETTKTKIYRMTRVDGNNNTNAKL